MSAFSPNSSEQGYRSDSPTANPSDPVYRIYMGITTDVSEEECNQLKAEEVSNLRFFFLSLSIFVLTSISGLILILPNSDENPPGLL